MSSKMKITNRIAQLPDEIRIVKCTEHANSIELAICWPEPIDQCCPYCGGTDFTRKGRSCPRTASHVPTGHRATLLTFDLQRYKCCNPTCRKNFTETPYWLHPHLRMTRDQFISICTSLQTTSSIHQIAIDNCTTDAVVTGVLKSIPFSKPEVLPTVLCIDEFKGSAGDWGPEHSRWNINRFHTNISDGRRHCVIDVLRQIDLPYLKEYFMAYDQYKRSAVTFFCTDMHGGFISLAKQCFPKVTLCIDMFHVIQLLNINLDNARRSEQKRLTDNALHHENFGRPDIAKEEMAVYRKLKDSTRILKTTISKQPLKWRDHVEDNRRLVKECLDLSPELKEAYEALQEFHDILETTSYADKRSCFNEWLERFCASDFEGTKRVAKTLHRYREYIRNSWKYGFSNAICEGYNNKIKVLKRNSFGLHSFENFRIRILFCCGDARLVRETCSIAEEKKTADSKPLSVTIIIDDKEGDDHNEK